MPHILFVHQNHPAQFGQLSHYLRRNGWEVSYATASGKVETNARMVEDGITYYGFKAHRETRDDIHPYLHNLENAALNGQGFARLAIKMKKSGVEPDVIMAHSGWGSGTFCKTIWPNAKYVQYLEWWYDYPPRDGVVTKDPLDDVDRQAKLIFRNLPFMADMQVADAVLVPTEYQRVGIPTVNNIEIKVLHDGVDLTFFEPNRAVRPKFKVAPDLPPDAPIITYATRGMEPYRGFPQFMAALAKVQQTHPDAHCVVAGNDSVHYGAKLPEGDSYKKRALAEHDFDMDRLHFVGRLPYDGYRTLLQRSNVHVYLTKPFVLSWSCIEAMSTGCPMVASDCPPVREALNDGAARFTDMEDIDGIADAIRWMLDHPRRARQMGDRAREIAVETYAQSTIFPQKDAWLRDLIAR